MPIPISIIVRSMGRGFLSEVISSVSKAAFIPIELVLVNAQGGFHELPPVMDLKVKLLMVNQNGVRLDRPSAANAGLNASTGDFVLFLDDDDLIDESHLQRLADCLSNNPNAVAAYTGVRLLDENGTITREINESWEFTRLGGMNFLPIHAVMFRATGVRGVLSFDVSLPLMEDWDFWWRLTSNGSFIQLPGCSATYRLHFGDSGLSGSRDGVAMYKAHSLVLAKIFTADPLAISRALFWFDTAVNHLKKEVSELTGNLESTLIYVTDLETRVRFEEAEASKLNIENTRIAKSNLLLSDEVKEISINYALCTAELLEVKIKIELYQTELTAREVDIQENLDKLEVFQRNNSQLRAELDLKSTALADIFQSNSWKITAPLRAIFNKIRQLGH